MQEIRIDGPVRGSNVKFYEVINLPTYHNYQFSRALLSVTYSTMRISWPLPF